MSMAFEPTKFAIPQKERYTVTEIAKIFEVTGYTVRKWINNGDLSATKKGITWYVTRQQLQEFALKRHGD